MTEIKKVNSEKLYSQVYDNLRKYIVENQLQPGDLLPSENELASQFGISRNVLRESLKALQLMGVVDAKTGVGYVIQSFSFDFMFENIFYHLLADDWDVMSDMIEVRSALELYYLRQAMDLLDDGQLEALEDVCSQWSMLDTVKHDPSIIREDINLDARFHNILFSKIDNALFKSIRTISWRLYTAFDDRFGEWPYHILSNTRPCSPNGKPFWIDDIKRTGIEHRRILQFLRVHDYQRAYLELSSHLGCYTDSSLHEQVRRSVRERQESKASGDGKPVHESTASDAKI